MRQIAGTLLVLVLTVLVPVAALGASARVTVLPQDEQGAKVGGALFIFALSDDPDQTFTVAENDAGRYEQTVNLPGGESEWKLTKVVATGFLPVRVSLQSTSGAGDVLQEVSEMALDPGTPIPAIRTAPGGSVRVELTLGDQREVMARFMEARKKARAEAEAQAAQQAESSIKGAHAEALRLYSEGDVKGSLPHFAQAVEENPDDAELRLTYARVLYKAGEFDEFEQVAGEILEQNPGNTELIMMLYSGRRDRGELSEALDAILTLKQLGASGKDLLPHLDYLAKSMGRTTAAVPAYEAILEINPADRDACVALATIHAQAGKFDLSDKYLAQAEKLDPSSAPALYYDSATRIMAKKNKSAAQLDRSLDLLNRTIALEPQFAAAYKALALGMWEKGDHAATRENLQKYLELNPGGDDREQVDEWLKDLAETE